MLAVMAAASVVILAFAMPETKPRS
jgi:hypothetical protein